MPIVEQPFQQTIYSGADQSLFNQPVQESTPGTMETLKAAFAQGNTLGSLANRIVNQDPELEAPPDWKPEDHLDGFEDADKSTITRLVNARTPGELVGIKNRIQQERHDKETLQKSGALGFWSTLGFGLIDPTFLAAAMVPEVAIAGKIKTAKLLTSIARGAAGAAAYEGGMQATQETRTAQESAVNIGAGMLLSAALGHLANSVPRKQLAEIATKTDIENGIPKSAGAAATNEIGTLAEEGYARGGETIAKVMKNTGLLGTDADILMTSEFATARNAVKELADIPGITGENMRGIANPISVESNVDAAYAQLADLSDEINNGWKQYTERVPSAERISKVEYEAMHADALRNGDHATIPEMQAAVTRQRELFSSMYKEAQSLGLAQKIEGILGSESYFMRMWDANKIRDNMAQWTQKLTDHFTRSGADRAEAQAAVQDVTDQLTHMDVGQSNWEVKINTPNSGRLKDRVLDVRDNDFKEFLVNDPMKVAKAYVKDLAPKLELAKKFGDTDMKQAFENIKSEHGVKKQKIMDSDLPQSQKNEKIKKLDEQREQAQDALLRVRDRILGTAGRLSPTAGKAERATVMAARNFRAYVASTKMGGTALTGGAMDTAKIIAEYGFAPTISRIAKLATSPEFRALSAANARRMGSMVEVSMQRRLNIAMEGGVTEGWAQHLTEGLYKYTGLSHITDLNRMLAASLMEDRVLAAAEKATNGTLSKYETGKLASLGLGTNELKLIAKEVARQGTEVDGVRVSGSTLWKDQELAKIYDRAILRESKIAVQQPGAADRVWWMDSELGKFLGQLKSFTLSSPARMLTPALQMAGSGGLEGWARFGRFAGFMMIGGAVTHMLRQKLSGREIDASPQALASNALTESGLAGILPDIIQPIGKSYAGTQWGKAVGLGEMFGTSKYGDRSLWSAYLGPSIGSAEDIASTAKRLTDGGVSASDLHALRRNLPWQNAWFMRRGINAVEGEMAENLGLPGSDVASFGERLTRTQALIQ